MRRVLATILMSLVIGGSALPAAAMDSSPKPDASTAAAPAGDPAVPAASDPGADEADATPSQDQAGSQAGSNDGVMQKFTRHRPGACPEGPPCKVED